MNVSHVAGLSRHASNTNKHSGDYSHNMTCGADKVTAPVSAGISLEKRNAIKKRKGKKKICQQRDSYLGAGRVGRHSAGTQKCKDASCSRSAGGEIYGVAEFPGTHCQKLGHDAVDQCGFACIPRYMNVWSSIF